jgi:hypothetical protein
MAMNHFNLEEDMKEAKRNMMKFMRGNPSATFEEFFKATNGRKQDWYSARYILKKEKNAEKIPKVKTVKVKSYKRASPSETTYDAVAVYNKLLELQKENADLKHQIVGFRSVISYLENLSGLRNSQ